MAKHSGPSSNDLQGIASQTDMAGSWDVCNWIQGKCDCSMIDVNKEAYDFWYFSMVLLLIFGWAWNFIPKGEKLNLAVRSQLTMVWYKIVGKIPAKKVIHIDVQANYVEFSNSYLAKQTG